jgi:hypothetical protein
MGEFALYADWLPTTTIHLLWIVIWLVLMATASATLIALLLTRWGRSRPLRICVILSLIAHLLLAGYAATIRIAGITSGARGELIEVALGDALFGAHQPARPERPWEKFPGRPAEIPPLSVPRLDEAEIPETDFVPLVAEDTDQVSGPEISASVVTTKRPAAAPPPSSRGPAAAAPTKAPQIEMAGPKRVADLPPTEVKTVAGDQPKLVSDGEPLPSNLPSSLRPQQTLTARPLELAATATESPSGQTAEQGTPESKSGDRPKLVKIERPAAGEGPLSAQAPGGHQLPELYRMRAAADRARQAGQFGGNQETEEAVKAGLRWLASAQRADGSWDTVRWGGGRDRAVTDHHRRRAGARAQTGVTALALLAFLGSGHTHIGQGPYQDHVRRGLEYLAAHQRKGGSLAGEATLFASLYCHGMATFALSEAYGMTGDERIRPYVERAVRFTLLSQNRQTGGWRYRPADTGDTSQLGWQVMALKSAELAGLTVPAAAKRGVARFLSYVSSGEQGGLASYRPGNPPNTAMTAEALFCRLFTGTAPLDPVANEAAEYLLADPPEASHSRRKPMNFYYWYYATLALYQRQDALWDDWNRGLQAALLATQHRNGELAGSWAPDTEWGPHGGRVYSTAMATLSLEVYYRFLPLYGGATAGKPAAARAR